MKKQDLRSILTTMALMGFLLGSYNGRLAVWKDDDPEPYRVYPCPIYLLPHEERCALKKGIIINDMADLEDFLENFLH